MPFERFFFDWQGGAASLARASQSPAAEGYARDDFAPLREILATYAAAEPKRPAHPCFADAAPCTLLIDEIEALWSAIDERDDWRPIYDKLAAITRAGEAFGNIDEA